MRERNFLLSIQHCARTRHHLPPAGEAKRTVVLAGVFLGDMDFGEQGAIQPAAAAEAAIGVERVLDDACSVPEIKPPDVPGAAVDPTWAEAGAVICDQMPDF